MIRFESRDEFTRRNKEVVLRYVDAFNSNDIDALCALFAPDAEVYGVLGWCSVSRMRAVWRAMMQNFRMSLHVDAIIGEGNLIAVRYTESGHPADPGRREGLGGMYEVVAMEWFEIRDAKILRRWCARDAASVFRQLNMGVGHSTAVSAPDAA